MSLVHVHRNRELRAYLSGHKEEREKSKINKRQPAKCMKSNGGELPDG